MFWKRLKFYIKSLFSGNRWMITIPLMMILATVLIYLIFPPLIGQYFGNSEFWDTAYYHDIARKGYFKKNIPAFYPLWPLLIRLFPEAVATTPFATIWVNTIAAALNLIGLVVCAFLFRKVFKNQKIAAFVFSLYAFNPYGVFRFIGYSESLFSLLAACLLYVLFSPEIRKIRYPLLTALSLLLSLCRPVMAPWIGACVLTWIIFPIYKHLTHQEDAEKSTNFDAVFMIVGLLMGYSLFGGYLVSQGFNFFEPFQAQKHWNKSFSLSHLPKNLFFPSTWGGTVVLIWDFIALWTPILLTGIPLIQIAFNRRKNPILSSLPATFCLTATLGTSMIVALTQESIQSIGRYNFGIPLLFIPIGLNLASLGEKQQKKVNIALAFITLWGFVTWWVLYGTREFMG